MNNVCVFFATPSELSHIMLIEAKPSFCAPVFCVLTVRSGGLYKKTHRLPSAARENTNCGDWLMEFYISRSWIDVIKICLRFVDLLLVSKWEPQQTSCFPPAFKIASILSSPAVCSRTSRPAVRKTKHLFRSAISRLWWGDDLFKGFFCVIQIDYVSGGSSGWMTFFERACIQSQ